MTGIMGRAKSHWARCCVVSYVFCVREVMNDRNHYSKYSRRREEVVSVMQMSLREKEKPLLLLWRTAVVSSVP